LLAEPDRQTLDGTLLTPMSTSSTNKIMTGVEQQVCISIGQIGECIESVMIHLWRDGGREDGVLKEDMPGYTDTV
jgi:hypothetical protein